MERFLYRRFRSGHVRYSYSAAISACAKSGYVGADAPGTRGVGTVWHPSLASRCLGRRQPVPAGAGLRAAVLRRQGRRPSAAGHGSQDGSCQLEPNVISYCSVISASRKAG